ncbi:hypothetical protein B0H16DRAFT_1676759 [Mycena metata]|uniref:Uncharacterized protein n=1 Tax=Mycena metata TaxID=1033252 RepID=A0AAD7I4D4_9AGAR|nr:hypothetical protein B0H16DRAFT_1676759 [Mycena metata]
MFTGGKSVLACASVLLALAAQTSAHAIPSPALGVKGTPARSDVQRPSTAKPCGSIDPATTIDTSTAIPAAADGTVTMTVTDFNAGADGSRSVAVQVDASGKGTSFVAGTVSKNGNAAPTTVGSDQVTFTLPAGTKCVGGKAGNLCLVSVKTTAGFGACTVVSQGAAAAAAPAAAAPPAAAAAGTTAAAAAAAAGTKAAAAAGTGATANTGSAGAANAAKKAGKKGGKKGAKKAGAKKAGAAKGAKGAKKAKAAAAGGAAPAAAAAKAPAAAAAKKAGTRAARALRLELNLD